MKKYLRFAGYLMTVLLLFLLVDICAGLAFDKFLYLENDSKLTHLFNDTNDDIAIIGASRAAHHYIPDVIEKELGLRCYNYGIDGRNIFNHYVLGEELLNNSSKMPKIVIVDVAYIDIDDTPGHNGEKLSNLYVLYNNNEYVKDVIDREDKEAGLALWFSNLFRYNSRLLNYTRSHIPSEEDMLHGYIPLYSSWGGNPAYVDASQKSIMNIDKSEYMLKLIQDYSRAGVQLMFYNSPDYKVVQNGKTEEWENRISRICAQNEVPFINHGHDSLFMSHKEWFNEPFHLNDEGARTYSLIVAKEISRYIHK